MLLSLLTNIEISDFSMALPKRNRYTKLTQILHPEFKDSGVMETPQRRHDPEKLVENVIRARILNPESPEIIIKSRNPNPELVS